ncbi:MAG: hypothetical protein U0998_06105 [Moraxellaceae bacterium]|nr:hypothetical protein [Moraxellaceae bacterium]MDZ4386776.1 hypothetical protein [Moraxellaceae bacterium]
MGVVRILILLSVLVVVATAASISTFTPNDLSGYGSVVAAAGSLLAVIWFSASLWLQRVQLREQQVQLEEQRLQFTREFSQLQETSRREAILMAKSILDAAEGQAIRQNGTISSISELPSLYLNFVEMKDIMESDDPDVVTRAVQAWIKKDAAATALMKGIKSAAEVYFKAVGVSEIDYTKEPEEFVYIYGPRFWSIPFFGSYEGTATILAQFMINLAPGRKAAFIAQFAATAVGGHAKILKMDKVMDELATHKTMGYPLPRIAVKLYSSFKRSPHSGVT